MRSVPAIWNPPRTLSAAVRGPLGWQAVAELEAAPNPIRSPSCNRCRSALLPLTVTSPLIRRPSPATAVERHAALDARVPARYAGKQRQVSLALPHVADREAFVSHDQEFATLVDTQQEHLAPAPGPSRSPA